MGVYKRGNHWWIDVSFGGVRIRETVGRVGEITKGMAKKAYHARKGELVQGRFSLINRKKTIPFKKLAQRYSEHAKANKRSWERDVYSINVFLKHFEGKRICDISQIHIEKYKIERKKEVKASTVNRELDTLRRMLNLAVEWGLMSSNPVSKVKRFKISNGSLRVLTEVEFRKLFENASFHLKPILITAINTGMRKGELLQLKWDHVNLESDFIVVVDSKNYESRSIPINTALDEVLTSLRMESTSEFVFTYEGKPIQSIKTSFKSAVRRSGIKPCRFHDLRHTFASRLVMAGVDISTVKELLGHKDIRMTMRYSHPTPEHKKEAVEKLKLSQNCHNPVTRAKPYVNITNEFSKLAG